MAWPAPWDRGDSLGLCVLAADAVGQSAGRAWVPTGAAGGTASCSALITCVGERSAVKHDRLLVPFSALVFHIGS